MVLLTWSMSSENRRLDSMQAAVNDMQRGHVFDVERMEVGESEFHSNRRQHKTSSAMAEHRDEMVQRG